MAGTRPVMTGRSVCRERPWLATSAVIPGLIPGIHAGGGGVDGRDEPGHDEREGADITGVAPPSSPAGAAQRRRGRGSRGDLRRSQSGPVRSARAVLDPLPGAARRRG
ncbi:hypothetical protein SLNSH_14060 [Alsobacter soli]|uniref:Uncharacterized protein n=1 Tax=Alsobacter soli TaxID=2109933 RepID=A0A2T1HRR2_9HYPH|nr:hypothetical protein SLNSH_14060 [Alsobacter soli]